VSVRRPSAGRDPFAVFRPRRARVVAVVVGVLSVVVFGGMAVLLPTDAGLTTWHLGDRLLLVGLGLTMAALFYRYATIRAVPTPERLVVRNLMTTRELAWPQVLGLQFGGGAPWVTLDLDDTDTLAVMAIQRSDGPFADAEASRLAALVQALGEAR